MAGAGGEEVGRISIRVVPDLDKFREQLLAELETWEKKKLKIKIELSGIKEARAEMQTATKDLTASIKAEANTAGVREKIKADVSGIKAKVKVEVDDKGQRRYVVEVLKN